tara:strand:- start:41 stop:1171 length:1131 start_codon:yes stop_codon:yes gene_type:complete
MGNRKSKESKDDDDSKTDDKKKEYFVPKSIKGLTVTATILLFVTMLAFFASTQVDTPEALGIPLMISGLASLMAFLGAYIREKKPIHEFFKTEEERESFNKTKGDGRIGITKDVTNEHITESPYMVEAYDASWGKYTSIFIGIFGLFFGIVGAFAFKDGMGLQAKVGLGFMYLIFGCIYAAYVFRKYKKPLENYVDDDYKYERNIVVDNRLKIFKSGDIQSINAKKEALRSAIDTASINICSNKSKIKAYMNDHITQLIETIEGPDLATFAGLAEGSNLLSTDANKTKLREGLITVVKGNADKLKYNAASFFGATLTDDQLAILNDLIVEIYVDLLVMPMIEKNATTNQWVLKQDLETEMKSELDGVLTDVCKHAK